MGPYSKKEYQLCLDTIVPELCLQQSTTKFVKVKDRERENTEMFSRAFRINHCSIICSLPQNLFKI